MVIVMMGAPGAGKGTQTMLLSRKRNIPALVMGDVLRKKIKEDKEIGKEIKKYVDRGELVPDSLVLRITREFLNQKKEAILDGIPRNMNQARALREERKDLKVVYIEVPEDLIVKRVSSRRVCENCGVVYNLITNPPKEDSICDLCKGRLIQREDDKEDVVRKRLEVYRRETAPMLRYFEELGCLLKIDGRGAPKKVLERLEKALYGGNN